MPSDYGHEQTDKLLKELEKRIDKEYIQAAKEVQEKFYAHMKEFERKDAKMQEKLDAGKITETEYQNWRTNQMLTGQRMNALYESLAKDLVNADQIAAGMINDSLPDVYALNMNYSTYKIEHTTEIDTNFTLYDRKTVENLMKDNPRIIPQLTPKQKAKIAKDELWNRQHLVSAVAQGILQGEGIPDIAKRLQTVAAMDDNAATRNARTYITAAQNKGRIDSYERAEKLGIKTNKKWIATLDDRTRVEHRHLDGVSIPYSDVFKMDGYEIEYPGDPSAEPEMIYNCRCTLVDDIKDWPYNDERNDEKLGDMTYEEWKHAKDKPGKDGSTKQDAEIRAEQEKAKEEIKEEKTEFEFIPAKTIAEAEEYAKTFVDDSKFGALGISYKGIGLDVANEINRTIGEFYAKYNVDKFGGIVVPKGNSKLGKLISSAYAAYSPVRHSFLVNNSIKSVDYIIKHLAEENDVIKRFLAHPENFDTSKMSKTVLKVLQNSAQSGRGTVPENIREIINHELGHSLEKQIKNADNYEQILKNMEEFAPRISGYSTESFGEYIAESFCSYQKGEGIVDDELIKAFKSLER